MDPIIRLLENQGIVTEDSADKFILGSPIGKVRDLVEQIRAIADEKSSERADAYEQNPTSAFNFLASRSVRGEGCHHWDCMSARVAFLARYAALYADHVLFPFEVPPPEHVQDSRWHRDGIALRVKEILLLRPVIDAGIAELVVPEFHFCEECAKNAKAEFRRISREADALYRAHRDEFSATYTAFDGSFSNVAAGAASLKGPAQYLEHGESARVYRKTPAWAPRHAGSCSVPLSKSALTRSGLVKDVFKGISWDVVFHQLYGIRFNANYLTGLPGEAEFMNRVSKGDEVVQRTAALAAQLTHSVPLFEDISVPAILRIRKEGDEAVVLYRAALAEIVRDHLVRGRRVTPKEARAIFRDILEPRLAKLKAEAKARRRGASKRALARVGVPTALICLGVWGGFLPTALSTLIKAVGGVNLTQNMAEALASIERNPSELHSHNLYYLLRLEQEAGD